MLKQWWSEEVQIAPAAIAETPAAPPPAASPIDRLRFATIQLAAASLVSVVTLALATGIRFDNADAGLFGEFFAALLLTSSLCWRTHALPRLADLLGTFGLVWLTGIVCGLISLVALHVQFPLVDGQLIALDRLVGIETAELVRALGRSPPWFIAAMLKAYACTIPLILVSLAALSLLGDRIEAWRAAFCFAGTILCVSLISVLTPAKGMGVWLSPEDFGALPGGSARYFWRTFDTFYAGADPVLGLNSIDGVVSFPFFHAIMGLIAIAMWRKRPLALAFVLPWAVAMFAAMVPIAAIMSPTSPAEHCCGSPGFGYRCGSRVNHCSQAFGRPHRGGLRRAAP